MANKIKVKVDDRDLEELTDEEKIDNYCAMDFGKKALDAKIKEIRTVVEEVINKKGVSKGTSSKSFQTKLSSIVLENRNTRKVDSDALAVVCKKKKVAIGTIRRLITPKNGNIPVDVLKLLDQHFAIEEQWEVSAKDIDDAVKVGLITEDDAKKVLLDNFTTALKPTVSDKLSASVNA